MDKVSYSLGANIAADLMRQGFEINDIESFSLGIKDVVMNNPLSLDAEEINTVLGEEAKRVQEEKILKNVEASTAFLAENAKRDGVTTLESGLQYEVITEGTGPKPTAESQVTTHYHGTLPDGTVFDSSVDRGQPASFGVNQVIKGWTEALQLMGQGSKWRLFIPSDLAYGPQGAGNIIGPNQSLVFEVELLEIK